jgi:hypothetical protein
VTCRRNDGAGILDTVASYSFKYSVAGTALMAFNGVFLADTIRRFAIKLPGDLSPWSSILPTLIILGYVVGVALGAYRGAFINAERPYEEVSADNKNYFLKL